MKQVPRIMFIALVSIAVLPLASPSSFRHQQIAKLTEQNERNHNVAQAGNRNLAEGKHPLIIGEDCSKPNAACRYFQPINFAESHPHFITEVAARWTPPRPADSDFKPTIEMVCSNVQAWLTELYHVQCMENNLPDDAKFCRPQEVYDGKFKRTESPIMFLPRTFTYKHVRKTGGNSFFHSFWALDASTMPHFHVYNIRAAEESGAEEMAEEHMEYVEHIQKENGDYPLIAVVRNPVDRFVSSASEILRDVPRVREECGSLDTNRDILDCVLILTEQGMTNVHLTPMFADMYCGSKNHDVKYSLYNMNNVGGLLRALGGDAQEKDNASHNGLSVNDLDELMVKRICLLYAWDVAMMKEVGFDVPECEVL